MYALELWLALSWALEQWKFPRPLYIAIYVLTLLVRRIASFVVFTSHDNAESCRNDEIRTRIVFMFTALGVGAFAGVYTALPAYIILMKALDTPGLSLGAYMECESVALWQKAVAVLP